MSDFTSSHFERWAPGRANAELSADDWWDVQRYVLEDPSLDRVAFEARMIDSPWLAAAVSECVEQVQWIALVSTGGVEGHQLGGAHNRLGCSGGDRRATLVEGCQLGGVQPQRRSLGARCRGWAGRLTVTAVALLFALGTLWWWGGLQRTPGVADGATAGEMAVVAESWLAMVDATAAQDADVVAVPLIGELSGGGSDPLSDGASGDSDWILKAGAEFFQQAES